jgi:hypothetical protein
MVSIKSDQTSTTIVNMHASINYQVYYEVIEKNPYYLVMFRLRFFYAEAVQFGGSKVCVNVGKPTWLQSNGVVEPAN